MNDELPTWADLYAAFGPDAVGAIDVAITENLSTYRQPIPTDDHYLVSEGLSFAVLLELQRRGLKVVPA